MRAVVYDWYTEVFPTAEEIRELCRPGAGADTCVWLVAGPDGMECTCLNKPYLLSKRHSDGLTVAKRDGCDKVKDFEPAGKSGEVEF